MAEQRWATMMARAVAAQFSDHADLEGNALLIEAALEAAGEMKASQAKIVLGRCREIIRAGLNDDHEIIPDIDKVLS